MDYEQKYNAALKIAEEVYHDHRNDNDRDWRDLLTELFPELKEPKEEQIRKKLIKAFGSMVKEQWGGIAIEDILAWLEKQGEKKASYTTMVETGDSGINALVTRELPTEGCDDEQKPVDEAEPKFHIGDKIRIFRKGAANEEPMTITKIDGKGYWSGDLFLCNFTDADRLKLVEQKPADKVEPMFNEGEWLCENEPNNYARFIQILETINVQGKERYRISRDIHNDEDIVDFGFVEKYYHKFDIQDAKDGDVLVDVYGNIGIFDKCYDFDWMSSCSLGNNGGFQYFTVEHENEKTYPATKEQRDLLFQKMKEAGYEYDNEKKELNKNDQTSADKIGSKFRVGNWYQCVKDFFGKGVTFDKNTAYYCAKEGCLQNEYGCHIAIVKDLYDNFKLWSIEDAKDGDVLAAEDKNFTIPFVCIYKSLGDTVYKGLRDDLTFNSYCFIGFNGNFYEGENGHTTEGIHPATKEQRDTLMKAMTNAKYAFDFDKKELKKIESKKLDPDKVIAWLNDQACQGWIEDVEVDKFVAKFKQDFEL